MYVIIRTDKRELVTDNSGIPRRWERRRTAEAYIEGFPRVVGARYRVTKITDLPDYLTKVKEDA